MSVQQFQWSNGTWYSGGYTQVDTANLAGGSGNDMAINNATLDFKIPGAPNLINLLFGEYGGNLNITINGAFQNFDNFVTINGSTIGGVTVFVANGFGNDMGRLTLSGPITQFSLGGQELWIDNVSIVPVPAVVWLFSSALLALLGIGRRRRF